MSANPTVQPDVNADPSATLYCLPPPYPGDPAAAASAPAYDAAYVPPSAPSSAAAPGAYPTLPADSAPMATPGAYPQPESTLTPGAYPVPVPLPADAVAADTPAPVSTAAVNVKGRNLMYFGVKNTVFCRDLSSKGPDGKSVEVWKRELGESSKVFHFNDVYVGYSSGIVVARLHQMVFGLDAATGVPKWAINLGEYGLYDMVTFVIDGFVLYAGASLNLTAISILDGKILWKRKISRIAARPLLTILACGLNLFTCSSHNMMLLNKADGSVIWDIKFPFSNSPSDVTTAAWDGDNTIMLCGSGYLYPVDVRTGEIRPKINLKGTGWNHVCVVFDQSRKVFYAVSNGSLLAVRPDGAILWTCRVVSGVFPALALEPTYGRIFVAEWNKISCVDTNGNIIFSKTYPVPFLSRGVSIMTQDLLGSGRIFVGCGGYFFIIDGEGNMVESDELDGMGYNQVFLCTPTASIDTNGCGDRAHAYEIRRPKN